MKIKETKATVKVFKRAKILEQCKVTSLPPLETQTKLRNFNLL